MELMPTSELVASKENQILYATTIIESVAEGNESALTVQAKIKFIQDTLKDASDGIKPMVVEELEKYDKREEISVLNGYRVELKEMGVKYDFSECNHPRLTEVVKAIDKLNEERKEIEAFLKTIKKSMSIADESTGGEEITIYPPSKKSTTTPVFTFKK